MVLAHFRIVLTAHHIKIYASQLNLFHKTALPKRISAGHIQPTGFARRLLWEDPPPPADSFLNSTALRAGVLLLEVPRASPGARGSCTPSRSPAPRRGVRFALLLAKARASFFITLRWLFSSSVSSYSEDPVVMLLMIYEKTSGPDKLSLQTFPVVL